MNKKVLIGISLILNHKINFFRVLYNIINKTLRKGRYYISNIYDYYFNHKRKFRRYEIYEIFCRSNIPQKIEKWKRDLDRKKIFLDVVRTKLKDSIINHNICVALNSGINLLGQHFKIEKIKINALESDDINYQSLNFLSDPGSSYVWKTDILYPYVRKGTHPGVDIKCPWEISRCYHFILLGEAYLRSNNEDYAREYRNQILTWVNTNPYRYGPNWNCTMEVGIRIANWLVGLLYFSHSPSLDYIFFSRFLTSIEEHGKHIIHNLENLSFFTSNHYLGNIAGLYFLAVLCPALKKSDHWQKFAKKELEKEIIKQTFEDGWHFESSMAYHRLVLEMFLFSYLLGKSVEDQFSANYKHRLIKMIDCLLCSTKPNAKLPQIGDNDSGRFLVFNCDFEPASLDMNYIKYYSKDILKPDIGTKNKSIVFKNGGRIIFKSPNIYFLLVTERKDKYKRNGHAHNDELSFELNVFNKDIFVDPGTYTYTRNTDHRNSFRSIANHNTLYWPGIEPCSLEDGLFVLYKKGDISIKKVRIGESLEEFVGCYNYRNRFHRREILFDKGKERVFIRDSCSDPGAQLSFMCAPKIEPKIGDQCFKAGSTHVAFEGASKIVKTKGEFSPAYGVKITIAKIVVYLRSKDIITQIRISKNY